jgi:hypothetical protein
MESEAFLRYPGSGEHRGAPAPALADVRAWIDSGLDELIGTTWKEAT